MPSAEDVRLAVVVADASTLDETVALGIEEFGTDRLVVTVFCPDRPLADRVGSLLDDRGLDATVEVLGPFSVDTLADAIETAAAERVVVDPHVSRSSLRSHLPEVPIHVRPRPTSPRRSHRRLRRRTGWAQRATLFALSFGFYLLLGDQTPFDVVTGAIAATVVVLLLSHVTFTAPPTLRRSLPRVARAVLFLPYLVWEILRANVAMAAVLLDPRLPIDPSLEAVDVAADSDLERAILANSITLTPGTLTVDVDDSSLVVHTLTEASRTSLRERTLERAVGFVFRGREADG
ncbi:Na+/H+ antiporter subunit E [Haloarchaeobius sp. HRN-SO-5]|uniref:Na+/H+ antiporter subunit E n=1 Tax=Haloarchaeobius sp. HRN-SO-5 TaxID=3446118 RepID=UPI003EBA5C76